MSDSPRTDGSRAIDVASDANRDEKIEQLLLAGLDHYFAARYEQAVNVWTRALFLDRSHPRARAYIERARSALAERQRESEELLQEGHVAFNRGESDEAKRLLSEAILRGAPPDEVHGLLDRLNRGRAFDVPGAIPDGAAHAASAPPSAAHDAVSRAHAKKSSRVLVATMAGSLIVAAAIGLYSVTVRDGRAWPAVLLRQDAPVALTGAPVPRDFMPPVPHRGEMALARARSLNDGGRLHEALAALELVQPTDSEKPEADRLRGEIQQRLLAGVANPPAAVGLDRARGRQP